MFQICEQVLYRITHPFRRDWAAQFRLQCNWVTVGCASWTVMPTRPMLRDRDDAPMSVRSAAHYFPFPVVVQGAKSGFLCHKGVLGRNFRVKLAELRVRSLSPPIQGMTDRSIMPSCGMGGARRGAFVSSTDLGKRSRFHSSGGSELN
jgi:hypothetical protein